METSRIRNFCIIAHIDHGKSTLADRFLELTGVTKQGETLPQFLDKMDIERERGITIKAQTVRMYYTHEGIEYQLNLVDTPGHVDFSYEVSRSLAACEGAILLVDATQGVEAQTIGNFNLACESGLEVIPVINKIDLPTAMPEETMREIVELTGANPEDVLLCSAKTGEGVKELLEAAIQRIPSPPRGEDDRLRALVFDSSYDSYKGVVGLVKVSSGTLTSGMEIELIQAGVSSQIERVGYYADVMREVDNLSVGEIGFVVTRIKDVSRVPVGDTITSAQGGVPEPLPGYKEPKAVVFAGIYPVDSSDYERLRDSLAKLRLNDSAFTYAPETSQALGFGFRCGFLGSLHLEVVRERLEREYNLNLLITSPSVDYRITDKDGRVSHVDSPAKMPPANLISKIEEPYVSLIIITRDEAVGNVMEICKERRCVFKDMRYLSSNRVKLAYEMPLSEMIIGFYDQLKSRSRGYASLDYEVGDYRENPLVKLEILVQGEVVDAFSAIVMRDEAYRYGRQMLEKLRKILPRQLFEVSLQAAVGGRIIARETIPALKKDVTAKCYGGDITRKRKLWEKQKAGKKRMKRVGKVDIPEEAFVQMMRSKY
ncbi:MAG: translation elongation factor 4 [Actinomycetota bacterium]|nr:translation elongation factor 4 [Actinomycetota bacterium]